MSADQISPGRYLHYKGKEYIVIGIATHSESQDPYVVYRPDYGDKCLWIRPLAMFCENVKIGDAFVPRFRKIADQ